jgi:hypothetical protein
LLRLIKVKMKKNKAGSVVLKTSLIKLNRLRSSMKVKIIKRLRRPVATSLSLKISLKKALRTHRILSFSVLFKLLTSLTLRVLAPEL